MKNAKINVIHFDSADVIATSGFNGYYLSGIGTASTTDNHLYQVINGITQTTDEFEQLKKDGSYEDWLFIFSSVGRRGYLLYNNRARTNDFSDYNGYYKHINGDIYVWQDTEMPNQ